MLHRYQGGIKKKTFLENLKNKMNFLNIKNKMSFSEYENSEQIKQALWNVCMPLVRFWPFAEKEWVKREILYPFLMKVMLPYATIENLKRDWSFCLADSFIGKSLTYSIQTFEKDCVVYSGSKMDFYGIKGGKKIEFC